MYIRNNKDYFDSDVADTISRSITVGIESDYRNRCPGQNAVPKDSGQVNSVILHASLAYLRKNTESIILRVRISGIGTSIEIYQMGMISI